MDWNLKSFFSKSIKQLYYFKTLSLSNGEVMSLHDSYKTFKSKFVNILTRFQRSADMSAYCPLVGFSHFSGKNRSLVLLWPYRKKSVQDFFI